MKAIFLLTSFCLVVLGSTHAAIRPVAFQETTPKISVDVELVNVVFTVFDKKGKLVTELRQDQFRVYEDNAPQAIAYFSQETSVPLTVALLADTSGSIREQLRFEQEAATEFFSSALRRGRDQGLVLTFASDVNLLQDYTDDPAKIAEAVKRMRSGGGTALYDAIYLAIARKLAGQEGRRAIILISDGDDTVSHSSLTEVLEAAQRNNVAIYTISTNRTTGSRSREQEQGDRGDRVLKKLADETGGKMFSPFKLQDLTGDFQRIRDELRAQYTLAYRPTNLQKDGTFRRIRIEVADNRYFPRARTGYFAPLD
jgi:VWFA-related protein